MNTDDVPIYLLAATSVVLSVTVCWLARRQRDTRDSLLLLVAALDNMRASNDEWHSVVAALLRQQQRRGEVGGGLGEGELTS
jgi:hypothetical protein